nr:UDP-glycosyltransferase 83A1-like [Tanacetum cinerariifolium]
MEIQKKNAGKTHVLIIPYIAQGHVIPLLELAQCLIKHGVKVTFVNTDVNHNIIMKTWLEKDGFGPLMNMVSIPDGMEAWEDRNNFIRTCEAIKQVMPGKLEELIETINKKDDDKISCVIADVGMPWANRVAAKLGIHRATFWSAPAAAYATTLSIQRLIDYGIINNDGVPLKETIFQLSSTMPPMSTAEFGWACMGTLETTKILFKYAIAAVDADKTTEWKICNSTHELESPTFNMFPNLLPIGPLLASNCLSKQAGHFWHADSTCLAWLDQQPMSSTIVVRPGLTKETSDTYPEGYMERIGTRGKIVRWAPQQEVLAHPSVVCFLSHCGWNSTLEGVSNAVPFLSWPYFADQLLNKTYICDIWRNGLGFQKDEDGIIKSEEIKDKVDKLLNNQEFKTRAMNLKEKVMSSIREGG